MTDSRGDNRRSWRTMAFGTLVGALTLLVRIPLMERGLAEDELNTAIWAVGVRSVKATLSESVNFNNHIGFSLVARVSEDLFGRAEWTLRFPALVLGVLSVYALWLYSASFLGSRLAMLPPVLLALSPAHVVWSTSARGYSGLILFTMLSNYHFFRLLKSSTRRSLMFLVLANVCGILFHLYAVFVPLLQTVFALVLWRGGGELNWLSPNKRGGYPKGLLSALLITFVVSAALYAPAGRSLSEALASRGQGAFQPHLPADVLHLLAGSAAALPAMAALLLVLLGSYSLARQHRFQVIYLYCVLVLPFALMWVLRPFDLYPRFFTYWLPCFLVFATSGIGWIWHLTYRMAAPVRVMLGSLFVAGAMIMTWGWLDTLNHWSIRELSFYADPGYRTVSQIMQSNGRDGVGLCAVGADVETWNWYLDQAVFVPRSVDALLEFARAHVEVRCACYDAPWQGPEQEQLIAFLAAHGERRRIIKRDLFVYRYRADPSN